MSEAWKVTTIRKCLVESFAGEWGNDPNPGNARVLRATDIDDDGHIVGRGAIRQLPVGKLASKQLQNGDIILEGSGGGPGKPVGRVAYFDESTHLEPAVTSNFFKTLRPNPSEVEPRFLLHKLGWLYRQPVLLTLQQQTTGIINLKFEEYLASSIEIPKGLNAQSKLAQVLDTLDTAIHETEAIIAKLKAVKQGLLHDLLTRGIDSNGELRPPQTEAPHLYKESPLGWIPKDWRVASLGEVSSTMTNGFVGTAAPHYSNEDDAVPYLYGNNIRPNAIDTSNCIRVARHFHSTQIKSQLSPGDLLTVQSGHIGTTAVVPDELGEANCHALIITRLADTNIKPAYVSHYCNSALGMIDMGGFFVGSTIPHINVKDFKRFRIPLPVNLAEQSAVCVALQLIADQLDGEVKKRLKLRNLKSGLMNDLLTGRVRVTPLFADATQGSV